MKEELKVLLEEAKAELVAIEQDGLKFIDKDNKAAGTRVRTGAMSLTKKLKEIRMKILEVRKKG